MSARKRSTLPWILAVFAIVAIIGFASMRRSTKQSVFLTRSANARKADAYHVVAYRNRKFIIDHREHRLTVKCEQAVTWTTDGPDDAPRPLAEPGRCVYITVGEYVGEDLMVEVGQKLTYFPWRGANTVQTADIMTITDEEEIRWWQ